MKPATFHLRLLAALLMTLLLWSPVAALGESPGANLHEARAHWLAADMLAWNAPEAADVYLHYSADASLAVTEGGVTGGDAIPLQLAGLVDGALAARFPHLAGLPAYSIPAADLGKVPNILRGQFALAASIDGGMLDATGIQPAGVLDDLYRYEGPLGVHWDQGVPTLRLWAPTAREVNLLLFTDSGPDNSAAKRMPMVRDAASGTWSLQGEAGWNRKFYLYEILVYERIGGRIETHRSTDPYSLSLSMDSLRSQLVNLDDEDLQPAGWKTLEKPAAGAPEDMVLYELHVRDFSISDKEVPEEQRGTFVAFDLPDSAGLRHLEALAGAGLSHVHLLPAFDCASIPENPADQKHPGALEGHGADSPAPQAAIGPIRDRDAFNWCYDPHHYTTPEGSYSTDPDGVQRILEFRRMVAALGRRGLRVVMDVVYNHTHGSSKADKPILDGIVPDYYYRLDARGEIETSTCCANTATEHFMMEKLMLDSLRTWATAYQVDAFRFDLMGHHSRQSIERVRDMLASLTPEIDGVDGKTIYLYGEGWNFGEVADNARFEQASQINMGRGTGVGTFNDRLRDAVRGGEHDDRGLQHVRSQGFINGLYTNPNAENEGSAEELKKLLEFSDRVRSGLAGSIKNFPLTDFEGRQTTAGQLDYNGQPAAYASDPQEVINYIAAHDNETLFDINQYKLPRATSAADRVRVQNLGNSIIALSQGVPFFHAGQDMLRSKSLDRNSYDSGDWFNLLDYSYQNNGWGRGLPPKWDNEENWPVARDLLADSTMSVTPENIRAASAHLQEMLRIRQSSPLFRLQSGEEVIKRLRFHNTGPDQVPGLVVMSLDGENGSEIVVLFNADKQEHTFSPALGNASFQLHPIQQDSQDPVVRKAAYNPETSSFSIPPQTTAVFTRR